jgi:hypothetical protein
MFQRSIRPLLASVLVASALTACSTSDDTTDTPDGDTTVVAFSDEYWQSQRQFIDSVLTSAPDVADVAKAKGAMYDVADDSLTKLVIAESAKTEDCYSKVGLGYDPVLTGVATVLVNFGAAGWDLIRVEDHQFSSAAGGAVVSCINARAKNEWKLPTKGIIPGAHLVQLKFRPDDPKIERKVY